MMAVLWPVAHGAVVHWYLMMWPAADKCRPMHWFRSNQCARQTLTARHFALFVLLLFLQFLLGWRWNWNGRGNLTGTWRTAQCGHIANSAAAIARTHTGRRKEIVRALGANFVQTIL